MKLENRTTDDPLFELGSVDCMAKTSTEFNKKYSSYSGVDINLYLNDIRQDAIQRVKIVRNHLTKKIYLEVIYLLLDSFENYPDTNDNFFNIKIKAVNEHLDSTEINFGEFTCKGSEFEFSIDDIVIEKLYFFESI